MRAYARDACTYMREDEQKHFAKKKVHLEQGSCVDMGDRKLCWQG